MNQLLVRKEITENSMRKATFILSLLLIAATAALAQPVVSGDPSAAGFISERLDRIDDAINAEIAVDKIPGAVALWP